MSKSKSNTNINLAMGTGRRKSAVARVYLREGKGAISINHRTIEDYVKIDTLKNIILSPLFVTDTLGKYDLYINVYGGGISGQAGAMRHGIARALLELDEKNKSVLRANAMLTRDARVVERKKYGKKKARKSKQFSKR